MRKKAAEEAAKRTAEAKKKADDAKKAADANIAPNNPDDRLIRTHYGFWRLQIKFQ